MLTRPTPAWLSDPAKRAYFRRKSSMVLAFPDHDEKQINSTLSRYLTLRPGLVLVPQVGMEPPYAIVQASRLHPRDYPQQPPADVLWRLLGEIHPLPPGQKWCSCCGDIRAIDKFYADPKRRDGRRAWCIACERRKSNERYAARVGRAA